MGRAPCHLQRQAPRLRGITIILAKHMLKYCRISYSARPCQLQVGCRHQGQRMHLHKMLLGANVLGRGRSALVAAELEAASTTCTCKRLHETNEVASWLDVNHCHKIMVMRTPHAIDKSLHELSITRLTQALAAGLLSQGMVMCSHP